MYKKISILIVLLIVLYSTEAQFSLILQIPPVGVMKKNQLWNMSLINVSNNAQYVYVGLTLYNTLDNQPVFTAKTGIINLAKGTKQLNYNTVSPIIYNYISSSFDLDRDNDGFLPVGVYKACYVLYNGPRNIVADGVTKENTILAEDCNELEVQPLSPPLLSSPSDKDTMSIDIKPQFTWTPPTPMNMFRNLVYDVAVVEVMDGQTPVEAIQQNLPIYNIGSYRNLTNLLPSSTKLTVNKQYAWQVAARDANNYSSKSEVWTFYLTEKKKEILKPVDGNYLLLKTKGESSGVHTIIGGIIGIKYYSFEREHLSKIRVIAPDGTVLKEMQEKIIYGDNFYAYQVDKFCKKNLIYSIEITDGENIKYTTSFIVKQ